MIHQGYAGRYAESEDWRAEGAEICLQIGLAMLGLGLLYWSVLLLHAHTVATGWYAALVSRTDPVGSLGDPFMWLIWIAYWAATIGFLRRGWAEGRRR